MLPRQLGSCRYRQVVQEEVQGSSVQLSYFLDGAHTPESMATCAEWFAGVSAEAAARQPGADVQRVLVFNCKQVALHISCCCVDAKAVDVPRDLAHGAADSQLQMPLLLVAWHC